jgi:RNA polymerase sigma-70 factor (ECF subfamily)
MRLVSEQRGGPLSDFVPQSDWAEATRVFNEHRELLIGVAYRVLGRASDAEDVVQDAWLRWVNARPSEVANPQAFLVRVTTRLAIDQLRRVKTRHESYVGPWLPEPLLTDHDLTENAELAESVSMAMLIVLETLSALERTVFVLREAFGMPYAEIAEILGRSEPAVRQLARRAREHVRERRPRFDTDQATRRRVTERFLAATVSGDLDDLLAVLAPRVTLVGDGGGRARAPLHPIYGADKVARFLVALSSEPLPDAHLCVAQVNGGPGIVATLQGRPVATVILDVADGVIQTIHLVANPHKLIGIRPIESD